MGASMKSCAAHPERASVAACRRCAKAVCTSCTLMTPQGSFCSPECGVLFKTAAAYAQEAKSTPQQRAFFTKVAAVFVLLVVALGGINAAASGVPALKRIDLLGMLLKRVERIKR